MSAPEVRYALRGDSIPTLQPACRWRLPAMLEAHRWLESGVSAVMLMIRESADHAQYCRNVLTSGRTATAMLPVPGARVNFQAKLLSSE